MHEMGIAGSVLEAVEKETRRYPGHRAAKVGLRIGRFAGVDGESLRFCFEALVKDSDFEPLELAIEFAQGDELDLAFVELEEIVERRTPLPCGRGSGSTAEPRARASGFYLPQEMP